MINRTFIIAEAGVNHNGDKALAYKLIDAALKAGADAVKFQTFKSENVVSKFAEKADYQKNNTQSDETQLQMVKKLELSFEDFIELKEYCDLRGIIFLSTPFDFESIDFLSSIGIKTFKVPSGEIDNLPFLKKVGRIADKIIISTGMCNLSDIEFAINILNQSGVRDITVLHCNTEYPTPMEDVNLKAMITIKEAFKIKVGYSDHTSGIEVPIAAVALGAEVIEKHFTLDKEMDGPDHKSSLNPTELKKMIQSIRNIESALGTGVKEPSKSELKNKYIVRKSIVASRKINKGETFDEYNITMKRPGYGISPKMWYEIIGKIASKDFEEDEMIKL